MSAPTTPSARSSTSLEEVFAPKNVAVEDVIKALSSMWRAAEGVGSDEGEGAIVRSRALTLIAIASDSDEFAPMANAVNAAISVVPARSVLVELRAQLDKPDKPDKSDKSDSGMTASVGGTCTLGGPGGKHFCQEQVVLRASGDRARDLASLLLPLSVSDLPFVLHIPSTKLLRGDLLSRLVPIVDVLVVDTDGCDDVGDTFGWLARLEDVEKLIVRDLAFERLRTWREAIASAYDEVAGQGARVTAVEAICADNDAQGSLLLGWIESRFAPGERPFVRMKRQVADEAQKGAVCGIQIEVQDEHKRSEIRFAQFGRHVVRVHDDAHASSCELPRPMLGGHDVLTAILADPIRDRAYDQALRAVIQRYAQGSKSR